MSHPLVALSRVAHEKGALFNFPGWVSGSVLTSCLQLNPPPLLGFTWVLEGVVSSLPGQVKIFAPQLPILSTVGEVPSTTWLPLYAPSHITPLQATLSHAWVDPSLVAFKAAKNDGAQVTTHLWSSHVSLVLGSGRASDQTLDVLRGFLLVLARHRLFQSLCRYLRRVHGVSWTTRLVSLWQHASHPPKQSRGGCSFHSRQLTANSYAMLALACRR